MSEVEIESRVCSTCPEKGEQPIGNFRSRKHVDYPNRIRVAQCRTCEREANRIRMARSYAQDPERILAQNKSYRDNLDAEIKYQRARVARYHITWEEYCELLDAQDHRCAACGDPLLGDRNTHIDHCHQTQLVRGVLCGYCNKALGLLKDDPIRVDSLLKYIKGKVECQV